MRYDTIRYDRKV